MAAMLDGYSFAEWPNLSSNRLAVDHTHTVTRTLIAFQDSFCNDKLDTISLVIVSIARVLGDYCGISDVLLAFQMPSQVGIHFVRVTWDQGDDWNKVIARAKESIRVGSEEALSLNIVRKLMSLKDDQYPFLALCTFDFEQTDRPIRFPPVFSYDRKSCILGLSASMAISHPAVSTQIISQVIDLIEHALHASSSQFSCLPPLPSDLMSICERRSEDDVVSAYPHISSAIFAPHYLARRAEDMPQATAVRWYPELSLDTPEFKYQSMSYLELHRRSNQIARWLLRLGLQQEDRVAVCMDRDLDFHAVMMGIMRAGGCYVPIDPELPLERKTYIVQDAKAAFVLTSPTVSSEDVFGSRTLYLTDSRFNEESDNDINCMSLDGLAYLLYTSGTTGNPKGCLLTHRGLSQAILALSSTAADVRMDNIHDGRYLVVASIAFDVHIAETILPIALGMPLLSARRSQLLENLPVFVNKLGVTHLGIVPSLIEATLNASQGGVEGDISLRYIASGGEKMSDSILDKWANHRQVRLANFYGPSEVTIGCCARYMSSSTPKSNIGRAFANVSAYVVDADMNILLRGGIGELVVEGPLVGRGYQGREDLTKKVFLQWPRKDCWSYRTGDLVRMMPDSTIEILGRIDTQIKLRGVRIESEGISAIIRKALPPSDSFVLDATTILAKHPVINVDQLVSFFTWDNTVTVSTRKSKQPFICIPPPNVLKQIKEICELELASYMRPSHFIPLSWLPLSSNGKTDTKMLTEFFNKLGVEDITKLSAQHTSLSYRQSSEVENKIFDILQKHVNLPFDRSFPDINVFECGLDSMGVIKFTTDIKDEFSVKIMAVDIMKSPRIADIASRLESLLSHKTYGPTFLQTPSVDMDEIYSNYEPNHIENLLPPFPIQEGVLSRSAEVNTLYVQHVIVACKQDVLLPQLRSSWSKVVQNCEILRTVFHFGRVLTQVILKADFSPLHWVEKEVTVYDRETFCQFFLDTEALAIAVDINRHISTIAPYRLSVYTSNQETFLALSIHHSLFDGIALPRIFLQVERHYLGLQLIPTTSASDILEHITSIDLQGARKFWEKYLSNYTWPEMLLSSNRQVATKRLIRPFQASLSSFKKIAASHHVTIQALFTCAFSLLLAVNVYNRKDLVFGVLRSGRLLPVDNIEDSISPLVSILPIRVNLGKPGSSLLPEIQRAISSSIEYEHISLGKLQGWIRPGNPLFEIIFSLSVSDRQQNTLWDVIDSEPPEADYPLAVEIVVEPQTDSISIQATWIDGNLFASNSPGEWLQDFEKVTLSITEDPGSFISQFLEVVEDSPVDHENKTAPEESSAVEDVSANPMVQALRSLVSEFLGFDPALLSPSMSLISMGLDSIKSVGLAKTLSLKGFKISSANILTNATLAELASFLESRKSNADSADSLDFIVARKDDLPSDVKIDEVKYTEDDKVDFYPTTALQTGMLSQTVSSKGVLYVHAFPLRLHANTDISHLHQLWQKTVQALAILRTTFHFSIESGRWLQAVHSSPTLNWSATPLSSGQNVKKEIQKYLKTVFLTDERSFRRPPFWLHVFESTEPVSSYVLLVIHHALYDGISIGKLLKTVEGMHNDLFPRPQTQFHELLPHFINQERQGSFFWFNHLKKFKPARLPIIHPSIPPTEIVVSDRIISLGSNKFKEILSRGSITAQCIGQAAWAKVLSKYTGSLDVVFGHTVSGRGLPGADDVIGPVLNTIPFCIRLESGMSNVDLLQSIHRLNLAALPWQQTSLRAIQKAMRVNQVWDSLFSFQQGDNTKTLSQSSLWSFDETVFTEEARIQYPLNVEMFQQGSELKITCASLTRFMDQIYLDEVVEGLEQTLRDILNEPEAPIFHNVTHNVIAYYNPSNTDEEENWNNSNILVTETSTVPLITSIFDYKSLLKSLTNAPSSLIQLETPLTALGIDSILAIQIVGKFRENGMKITASDVITSQNIGQMLSKATPLETSLPAQSIASYAHEVDESEATAIRQMFGATMEKIDSISSISSGMKWIVGSWQKSKETRFQHAFAFKLPNDVDVGRMKAAWFTLIARHPILRSTFVRAEGYQDIRLVIFKEANYSWSEDHYMIGVGSEVVIETMKSFLSKPPPLSSAQARAFFLQTTECPYFVLHLHHFQYDAWSLQLLFRDLLCIYQNLQPTASSILNDYIRFVSPNPESLKQQEVYWRKSFPSSFEPIFFPSLRASQTVNTSTIQRIIRTNRACIPDALRCQEKALSAGVSLESIFLASWALIQGRISASTSSTFGLWHSGRTCDFDDIANLAISCINVLPFHISGVDKGDVLDIARWIQIELPKRTSVIEQSDLIQVNKWLGLEDRPLCNVSVNIIKVAPDTGVKDSIFKPVEAPYYVPGEVFSDNGSFIGDLAITQLINDDLMIDITTIGEQNSVMITVDAAASLITEDQADDLMSQWASCVRETLELA